MIAIIAARNGSTRLSNKSLLKLYDKTILEHIIDRLKQVKKINKIILATTIKKEDDSLCKIAKKNNIYYFRGDENNVLYRFWKCSEGYDGDHIIRIVADSPCLDYKIIEKLIEKHLKENNDLTCMDTLDNLSFCDGLHVEIITKKALNISNIHAKLKSDLEHVTTFAKNNSDKFKIGVIKSDKDYSYIRLSIDYKEDYDLLKHVFNNLYPKNPYFGLEEIVKLFEEKPELLQINGHIINNIGYQKSLEND
jgi:spore coat polysaccharide biosynthesis protein SpsF